MKTHDEMVAKWMEGKRFRDEYDRLEPEFSLFDELLKARARAGVTQAEVARRMNTTASSVSRLESSGANKKHSPSVASLRKYADAVGCRLEVRLVPVRSRRENAKPTKAVKTA